MKLKWLGHAAFLITADNGTTIVTDPYTPETSGYEPITDTPNIVIISSDNDRFHCRADLVPGDHVTLNALDIAGNGGVQREHGIEFRAIQAMEALDHRFHDPDQNGMYRFEVDGVHVGHMGDVGNAFSDDHFSFFSGLDVLLALAGGHPTIDLADLKTVIERVQPRIVVPMHFRTLRYKPRNTFWISDFLALFNDADVDFPCATEISINREMLPISTRAVILQHSN